MCEIIEFLPTKREKNKFESTLKGFDESFFSLTSSEIKNLKKLIKAHFKKIGIDLLYTSKQADFKWVNELNPLLYLQGKIGFSYEIDKPVNLDDGWMIHPLVPQSSDDILHNINYIAAIIRLREKGNE